MRLRDILKELTEGRILYHGGLNKLTKLDPDKVKGGVRASIGWGVYFTSSKDKALDYGSALTLIDSSKLKILNMDNPVTQDFVDSIKKMSEEVPDTDIIYKYKLQAISDYYKNEIGKDINTARKNVLDKFRHDHEPMMLDIFRKMGYDAVSSGYECSIFNMDAGTKAIIKESSNDSKRSHDTRGDYN
jgi:hypothetical protein